MEKVETLTEILINCLNCAYFDFYKKVDDVEKANELVAQFLINNTYYDDIFESRGLKGNPIIYKKILIMYLSLKVYMSELYNKENSLQLRTSERILKQLDDVFSSSELIYNFVHMDNYRITIVKEGIRLVLQPSEVRNYKQLENIKKGQQAFKMLHLFPQIMLDFLFNSNADTKDMLINDIVEIYQFELSKRIDNLYQIKNEMLNEVLSGIQDGLEEEEIEDMIQDKFEGRMSYYLDEMKMMEDVFTSTWGKIKEKCKTKEELYNLIGLIIGNVYVNLSLNEKEITHIDKEIKEFLELPIDNRNMYIEAVLNKKELGFVLLDLFLEYNSLETTKEDRLIKEEQLRKKGPKYIKVMKMYDTFYKDK